MIRIQQVSIAVILGVIISDILIMNIVFALLYAIWPTVSDCGTFNGELMPMLALFSLCYFLCTYPNGVILHRRNVRVHQITMRVFRNIVLFAMFTMAILSLTDIGDISARFFATFYTLLLVVLTIVRIIWYQALRKFRSKGHNNIYSIYLGSTENMLELVKEMSSPESGYRVRGYFDFAPNPKMSENCPYLGHPEDAISYLKDHGGIHQVYCSLPSAKSQYILPVINYCENNVIHFYSVPNVRNYLHRRMWFDAVGEVPVLSLHREPLNSFDNRIIKRTFDVVLSGIFLCTLFPIILLFVGVIIKITSPGPIFFRQKRNGINGKEFWCYKFRSMKVNKEADTLQATEHDPRKTKFGDFMRRTNIDELPQFINVFLGDMSIVGPRPHMLKHTEEYSQLIDKYMVRHFIKPGVTGWAQVTGYRGETKELAQMEGRIQADIWYIEHWTFMLDLYIMYKTVANVIIGDKEAY